MKPVSRAQSEDSILAQALAQRAEGLHAPGVYLKGVALRLGEQVSEQSKFQQQGNPPAVQRRPGQQYPAEISLPVFQNPLKPGEVVPVKMGQQEMPVHRGLIPVGNLVHPAFQRHVPFPQALADAAAVHHQDAAVPALQHHALAIFHVE